MALNEQIRTRLRNLRISSTLALTIQILLRYIPFIYPGAALDRTANNCLFIGYFLVVLYTATSTVWILALRPVILDLPPARPSPQPSRSAAKINYLKVKEDSAGNWFQGRSVSSISLKKQPTADKKSSTPKCETGDSVSPRLQWGKAGNYKSNPKDKAEVSLESGNSLLGNCCGGRRNETTQSIDQSGHEACSGVDESQRNVNFQKDAHTSRTPRGEDAAPAVLASSVLVRRSASHPLPAHRPPDDYISRALARSSAAIGWGTTHNAPPISGAE
eukprot:CAMPEP_0172160804 /NCGR_PEP_ID=MMETSP1050-20130122/5765_1 /TAXON_ID=233186 /ORGANISM="Cryptomonas curvata, Strain CCAP979/52" /LENGTH=273 /DNA_ID=CAMNT_0012830615 /DNA_START=652 /DNA_END=1472 /DNA_ORIENTATION=-